jgi:hypothetical protein
VLIHVQMTLTSAATSDAIAVHQYPLVVDAVTLYNALGDMLLMDTPLSGCVIRQIMRYVLRNGLASSDHAAIAADSNAARTVHIPLYIPAWQPAMDDPEIGMPLAGLLQRMELRWSTTAAATLYGTGQAATVIVADVYADVVAKNTLEIGPEVRYGSRNPAKFSREVLGLNGKVLFLTVADTDGSATASIGTTDFTDIEIQGHDGLECPRQDVDSPGLLWNCTGGEPTALAYPTASAVESFLLYAHPFGCDAGCLPNEGDVTITLATGAGAPAVADQEFIWGVLRKADTARTAQSIGASKSLPFRSGDADKAAAGAVQARGKKGGIARSHPMFGYLRRRLDARVISGRM